MKKYKLIRQCRSKQDNVIFIPKEKQDDAIFVPKEKICEFLTPCLRCALTKRPCDVNDFYRSPIL